jgi:hypothetical protein
MDWSYQVLLPAAGQGALDNTLAANAGSFAASGLPADGKISRRLKPGTASFSLDGSAHLRRTFILSAASQAFTVSGQPVTAIRGVRFTAGHGAIAASGAGATLRALRRLATDSGAFAVSAGTTAIHLVAAFLAAGAGSIALGGKAASPRLARRIGGSHAAFSVQSPPAATRAARRVASASGSLATSGQPCALAQIRRLTAERGAFTAAGQATSGGTPGVSGRTRTLSVGISIGL